MPPEIILNVIPTGGGVALEMPGYVANAAQFAASGIGTMSISRAVSGSAFVQLYSGSPQPIYIDFGDGLPGPLSSSTAYYWQVSDATGVSQVGPVVPGPSLVPTADPLTQLLIRALQAGVSNLTLPPGFGSVQVTTKMPQGGLAAMPFIVVNLDLIQQSEVGIGQNVEIPDAGNSWTIWVNCKRVWRISIMSQDAEERDFYRDSLLSIFQVLLPTVFDPIGVGVTHDLQAASGTDANEWEGRIPGFYYADIMLTVDGVMNTTVLTGYGLIEYFGVDIGIQPDCRVEQIDE